MFTDPQSLKIGTVTTPLPRVSTGTSSSIYSNPDATLKLSVSHQGGKGRARRSVRADHSKFVADPLTPANQTRTSMSAYLVVDVPANGYTVAQQQEIVKGLTDYLSVPENITKLLGGES